jgi:hypothetical protein
VNDSILNMSNLREFDRLNTALRGLTLAPAAQSFNIKSLDLGKIDDLFGGVANEIRKMELARASWMSAMTESHSLREQIKVFTGETPIVAQMAKQWRELQMAEQESVRKILDPLQDVRKGFLSDSATKRILDDLAKPFFATEQVAKLVSQTAGFSASIKAMHSSFEGSMEGVRKPLENASISTGIVQLMKSFEEANKRWVVPQVLLNSLGPLQALQEQLGRISLPVMDAASAATLASLLGSEGILAQLAAIGIDPDGSINVQFVQQDEGIDVGRKDLDLTPLLNLILMLLILFYQETNSDRWQAVTDKTLAAHTQKMEAQGEALEAQRKMIESLTKLVEKAVFKESMRKEERFVVLDRVVIVRVKPEHGASVESKLLPREVVRPISESGKWIEFEYYDWLRTDHRTGWALKKYFQRVPTNFENTH